LLSAIGQDVVECLFSAEVLERDTDGRSKIIRPLWVFAIALVYNVTHAAALLYQVITLNVAVNSYSNALLTLLLSNQFVEIKGAVFKKIERENLFQLTCADIVERFQLWLMLFIIAMRNMVEVGGISISLSSSFDASGSPANATGAAPSWTGGILPTSFTMLPRFTGQVLGPFLIVLGSEMLVDWLKHAYINKFNNIKPALYGRFLYVMAKDYYTNAFSEQNLTKRIGLPTLPLACLFIRSVVQTCGMFVETNMPLPLPSSATDLSTEGPESKASTPTLQALAHIDHIFRRALGRASFPEAGGTAIHSQGWSIDDVVATAFLLVFCLVGYLFLLAAKLVLGMVMLRWARSRYRGMKERDRARDRESRPLPERKLSSVEPQDTLHPPSQGQYRARDSSIDAGGRRLGIGGVVEIDEDKRRLIYDDDPVGLARLKDRDERGKRERDRVLELGNVTRYSMVAKRIW